MPDFPPYRLAHTHPVWYIVGNCSGDVVIPNGWFLIQLPFSEVVMETESRWCVVGLTFYLANCDNFLRGGQELKMFDTQQRSRIRLTFMFRNESA